MKKCLNNTELSFFCEQLSLILHSGISALEGISIMKEDAKTKEAEEILAVINDHLEETGLLHEALKASGVFPAYLIHMTEIGERSGTLDEVMSALALHYQREEEISRGIRDALTYPLIMLSMLLVVLVVLVVRVMPIFAQVFYQLGAEMDGISGSILSLGTALERYAAVFIALLLILAAVLVFLTKSSRGRRYAARILNNFPPSRELNNRLACSRFAGGMSIALKSGLDTDESFQLVSNLIENEEFRKKISHARKMLEEGEEFTDALNQSGIFSGVYARMVSIGFRTGSADAVLEKISVSYQEDADAKLQNLISMLEPTLVAILSILVGMILLSVMLPLVGIMSNIG